MNPTRAKARTAERVKITIHLTLSPSSSNQNEWSLSGAVSASVVVDDLSSAVVVEESSVAID